MAKANVGAKNPMWKGGRFVNTFGYVLILNREHPRADHMGYVREHLIVAEKAVGHYLPSPICIHHVDGNRQNNSPQNLVICPNNGYHRLLHNRIRALKFCGNANWKVCGYCHKYDDPQNLLGSKPGQFAHRKCRNAYALKRHHKKRKEK